VIAYEKGSLVHCTKKSLASQRAYRHSLFKRAGLATVYMTVC